MLFIKFFLFMTAVSVAAPLYCYLSDCYFLRKRARRIKDGEAILSTINLTDGEQKTETL
jgi:hypothetical protein